MGKRYGDLFWFRIMILMIIEYELPAISVWDLKSSKQTGSHHDIERFEAECAFAKLVDDIPQSVPS